MREGWETKKLADLCKTFADGDWIEKKDQSQSGIRLVQTGNVGNGVFRGKEDSRHYISQETFARLHCTEIFPGDILVSRLPEPVGRACLIPETGEKMITAVDCTIIRLNPGCSPRFFVYYSQSAEYQHSVREVSTGTTRQRISRKNLGEIGIPVPPLAEQQRIVDILDREFAKLDALKANTEKSLQAAKDLFQATTDTMLGKEQWRELTIGEIAKIKGGKRVPKGYKLEKEPTAHRYIRVADFTDQGTIRPESVLYISDEVYKTIKAYTISTKDVYISIAGTIGKSGIIPDALDGANLTENACKLVLGPDYYNRFVFFATKTSSFKKQVETLTMQAAQPKLALTRLATIKVRVPSSFQEQDAIVDRLDGIADTIALLQDNYLKTLSLCGDLKQSFLRKAFNGEL